MASTYEFVEANYMSPASAIPSANVNLELLNKKISQTLVELGLTEDESKVLLFMNKKGEMKATEIAKGVEIPRTRLYYILENLQNKGLVVITVERPTKYRALPLDKAVDFLIDSYKHKLNTLEKAKQAISNDWSSLRKCEVVRNPEPEAEDDLQFISGEYRICNKATSLVMQATRQVDVFVNVRDLAKISYADITDKLQSLASNGVSVRILTNASLCDESLLGEVNRCNIKEIPHDFNDKAHFIIVDNKELMLLHFDKARKPSAMWTNSSSLVDTMSFLFAVGWRSACTMQKTSERIECNV